MCVIHCCSLLCCVCVCVSCCSRQLAKWRRSRKFVCLLIEEVPQDGCESTTSSATYSSGSNSSSFSSGYDDYDDLIVGGSSSRSSSGGLVVATATISLMQVRERGVAVVRCTAATACPAFDLIGCLCMLVPFYACHFATFPVCLAAQVRPANLFSA